MIYSINESNSIEDKIALFGEEADNFLESVGVALYESTIVIGENTYNGVEAESFLNDNGIFLYEDHIVLEGKQAEEYKARKQKEEQKKFEEDEKFKNKHSFGKYDRMHYPNASKHSDKYNNTGLFNHTHDDDHDTEVKARMLKKRDFDHKLKNDDFNMFNAMGARTSDVERHIRHQKKYKHESTIFDFDLK